MNTVTINGKQIQDNFAFVLEPGTTLIQGFTRGELEAALAEFGGDDKAIAAALQMALHRALPAAFREIFEEDHQAAISQLLKYQEEYTHVEYLAENLRAWLQL